MDNFYSCEGNFTYTNNDGVMSIEFNYHDSDDNHCGTYQEGTDILTLLNNMADDIEDQLAAADDNKADLEEIANIEAEIAQLNDRLTELKTRTNTVNHSSVSTEKIKEDAKDLLNMFSKESVLNKQVSKNKNPYDWFYNMLG